MKPKKFKIFANFLLAFSLTAVFLSIIVSRYPAVKYNTRVTPSDIALIKNSISKSIDQSDIVNISINEKQLNQLIQFSINSNPSLSAKVNVFEQFATVNGSLLLTKIPMDIFLNIQFNLEQNNILKISKVRIGWISLPDWIADKIMVFITSFLKKHHSERFSIFNHIKNIQFNNNTMTVSVDNNRALSSKMKSFGRDLLLTEEERQLLSVYYEKLVSLSRKMLLRKTELVQVIQPLFALANARTKTSNKPISEIRAVFIALTLAATRIDIRNILFDKNSKSLRNAFFTNLTLHNRRDLALHYLISAALTASTNKYLTETIGIAKEILDSQHGSGFSFADLLADNAGSNLASFALSNNSNTNYTINYLSKKNLKTIDIMPTFEGLPEQLNAKEFKKRFISTEHEKFKIMEKEILMRINNCRIFKGKLNEKLPH